MQKRNRIIVLVDFSKHTENLMSFAFSISKLMNAKILFIHKVSGVVPALADEGSRIEILKVEIEDARRNLRELVRGRDIDDEAFFVSSKPVLTQLQEVSNDKYFDWVLTGLKGTGTLKRLLIGSTPLSIIDESSLLTLAIPVRTKVPVPTKLLVGVTLKYKLNKNQLENVLLSLKEKVIHLEFFSILKDDEDETKTRNYLLELQTEYTSYKPEIQLYKGNNALNLLKERVRNTENSFLVLQQGSRTLTDKLFRSFMINELVYDAHTPLIVLSS
ncbi:MAG TPA: universal stress protein [Gillisia sp.]|nr:universal stress protein [Gillisia sp.]